MKLTIPFITVLLATIPASIWAQQVVREVTPLDQTRREVRLAQEALLSAHPNLERDLESAPPAQLRAQIDERRQLAKKMVAAKAKYYEQMAGAAGGDLDRLQSTRAEDPAFMRSSVQSALASVKVMREQAAGLRQQIDSLKGKPNSGAEVDQLTKQLEVANEIVQLHEGEAADTQAIVEISTEASKRLKDLVENKRKERDAYRKLLELARTSGGQYNRYFDALQKVVDERDGKKKTVTPPKKGKQ